MERLKSIPKSEEERGRWMVLSAVIAVAAPGNYFFGPSGALIGVVLGSGVGYLLDRFIRNQEKYNTPKS